MAGASYHGCGPPQWKTPKMKNIVLEEAKEDPKDGGTSLKWVRACWRSPGMVGSPQYEGLGDPRGGGTPSIGVRNSALKETKDGGIFSSRMRNSALEEPKEDLKDGGTFSMWMRKCWRIPKMVGSPQHGQGT